MLHSRSTIAEAINDDLFALLNDYRRAIEHFDCHPVTTPLTEADGGSLKHS